MAIKKMKGPDKSRQQLGLFEEATRAFRAGDFQRAGKLFAKAAEGTSLEIAHRARIHVLMCERRLNASPPAPQSAEEHYTYGVTLINARRLDVARGQLEAALSLSPEADHIYYALALCLALAGDSEGACQNLKRAIDLRPQNRITARQDADFAPFASRPPFDSLLGPEPQAS